MSFKSYKQSSAMECVACVAAMATNTTPQQFVDFLKKEFPYREIRAPYSDIYLQRYLLEFNLIVGVGLGFITKNPDNDELGVAIYPLHKSPAFVTVKIPGFKVEHALYWDGKKIWDPNPNVEDGLSPFYYPISGWFPIIKVGV